MTVTSNYPGAIFMIVSLALLGMLSLLCVRCKRKSKIINQENQIYVARTHPEIPTPRSHMEIRGLQQNVQPRQYGRSRFATMQPETVTRPSQTTSNASGNPMQFSQASLENSEPTYVAPLPNSVYENIDDGIVKKETDTAQDPCDYENVFPSLSISGENESDYENSSFLEQMAKEDESEYVNIDTA
ncbi:LAT2 domain-containing protein isoform X2 [Lampris incognitus]|uniref:LAT2 domain-containing protein isoform X2 n=1 Tax=Lampris incognitus TaxID=2546036 RepID=UPI0024B5ED32|nr:LAT2 domain-containing protein isoform X2 [Lampris incognitus]